MTTPLSLTRAAAGSVPSPPVRIVHIGLGAFHRSHQAWYTAQAPDAAEWGIAAFSGRSDELVQRLRPQGGVYTLTQRGPGGDSSQIIPSIVEVHSGQNGAALIDAISRPAVVILTLTITEAGYPVDSEGRLDLTDPAIVDDIAALRGGSAKPGTVFGRILAGLDARRRVDAEPLAIVSCDNMPSNGEIVRGVLDELARSVADELADWLREGIRVVSTSVDRITPRIEPGAAVVHIGDVEWLDTAPVVAEPFSDWVLEGEFPGGRPTWEAAGARFVDDVEPWERRKLWMLNGAHTILAALGMLRGHETVSAAVTDQTCRDAVEQFWDEASRHLPDVDADTYRVALVDRFANPRIEHRLAQIAQDSLTKARLRIVPIAERERDAGRPAAACAAAIAACLVAAGTGGSRIGLSALSATLGADRDFSALVGEHLDILRGADAA